MNEYLYELIKDLSDDDYIEIIKRGKKRTTVSEGEEDYEVICM